MAVYKLARFDVRPEARDEAERAMHAFASFVRQELEGSQWTSYRDKSNPGRYVCVSRAEDAAAYQRYSDAVGTKALLETLEPLVTGVIEQSEYELMTSSDLAPRHRDRDRGSARSRRRLGG